MRNSIFKSFARKILRSEAFVSVAIVFVLALGIMGTSYALYMDVDTDTDYQVVQVGNLYVGFSNDGDNTVTLENMLPMEDEYALDNDENNGVPSLYSFYIYNSGTYTAKYSIKLVTSEGNELDTKYINYIVCKDNAENCSDVRNFGIDKETLVTNDELSPKKESDITNPSVYYFLKIWVNSSYAEKLASKGVGEKIELKVIVESTNASGYLDNTNTLAGAILNNGNIKIYNNTPNIVNNDIDDSGIYKASDDYGISYYFRGNSNYNYVNFADKCWRVVRIQGDGSIKLVLASNKGTCSFSNLTDNSAFITTSPYNISGIINYNQSEIKTVLDNWSNKVFDSIHLRRIKTQEKWCIGDITNTYSDTENSIGTVIDYQENSQSFNYLNYVRLNILKAPSFKCNISNDDNLNNEIIIDKVGLLSADEVYFAANQSYLKENANGYWWTLTPAIYDANNKDSVFWVDESGKLQSGSPIFVNHSKELTYVRPAITLLGDTIISSGDGTINDPYVIN